MHKPAGAAGFRCIVGLRARRANLQSEEKTSYRGWSGLMGVRAEEVDPVGDDAIGAEIDQALGGPLIVDGVGEASEPRALSLRDRAPVPQRVVADDGHAFQGERGL